MPQKGFHCIVDFVDVPYEACIDCAATKGRCQFTASLLRGMADQAASREPDAPNSVSVTSLTGCARQTYLKEIEPFYQRPDEQYWAYRGTIGHMMVERGAGADVIAEQRFARELRLPSGRTLTITGRPDEIVPARKLLVEYKTTDRPPKTPSLQHIAQLNAYRWVVAPEHPIERLGIVYLTMRSVQKVSIPVWPDEQVERFLAERAAGLVRARETGEWPAMTEDTWMCSYCPVARACQRGPVAPADGDRDAEPVVEPDDLDEWDPAERGALVAAG